MPQNRWFLILLSLLMLFLAHGMALFYRVQPAVSLWFPPSGVAIALTLWLGPIAAVLTGIVSVTMAPFWGSDGWTRLVGLTDVTEPDCLVCLSSLLSGFADSTRTEKRYKVHFDSTPGCLCNFSNYG
ncbi:MAG: hypothetical protein C4322_15630 [Mastigocladus sp. ERB_26_1]